MNSFRAILALSLTLSGLTLRTIAQEPPSNDNLQPDAQSTDTASEDTHTTISFSTRCIGWVVLGFFGAGGCGAYMRRRPTSLVLCAILVFAVFRTFASAQLRISIIPPLICIAMTFLLGPVAKTAANEAVSEGTYMEEPFRFRSHNTLSFAYILTSVLLFASIWLEWSWWQFTPDAPDWTIGRKVFLSGFILGGLPFAMWIDTIVYGGVAVLRSVPLMALIFPCCRRGRTLVTILVFCLCFWHSPYAKEPSPYKWEMTYSLVAAVLLLWLQPPYVLMLGASSEQTGSALERLSTAVFPFRVVALFDQSGTGRFRGSFSMLTDNLRTVHEHDWRPIVDHLNDLIPLIVLDARTDRPVVVYEAGEVLRVPSRLRRAVFIIGDDGAAPALAAHGRPSFSHGIVTTREKDIPAMLAFEKLS
jgi:hypothetical protein